MNILVLDQFSEMGGAQRCLVDLLTAVEQRGWKAHVLIPPGGPLLETLRSMRVSVTEIPCGPYRSGNKSVGDLSRLLLDIRQQAALISDLTKRIAFDLVYVNGPRVLPAPAIALSNRIPAIFHAHSSVPQSPAARLARWSVRRLGANVLGCTNYTASYLRSEKLCLIPNGVADLGFRERPFGHNGNWRIGIVGRISREKGQIDFLRAAAMLAPEFPNASFAICGTPMFDAPPTLMEEVRALASGLPVEFMGWRQDIRTVFAELDLLVIPSSDEGMPLVLLEAFSAGVPVVAYPAGGIPEVISHGQNGFLVASPSADGLAACIRDVIRCNPQVLASLAANARRAWEQTYTLAAFQQRVTAVMERLVSGSVVTRETSALPTHR